MSKNVIKESALRIVSNVRSDYRCKNWKHISLLHPYCKSPISEKCTLRYKIGMPVSIKRRLPFKKCHKRKCSKSVIKESVQKVS